jgi:hypothetical protein
MPYELDKYRARVTDAEYLDDLRRVAVQLGQPSLTGATYRRCGRFHSASIARRFGSWALALRAAGLSVRVQQNVPADIALSDLGDVAKRLGRSTLSCKDYELEGKYSSKPLVRAFGSWNAALLAANLQIGKRAKISDDELFDNIERIWQTLGRQPKYAEIEQPIKHLRRYI